MRKVFISGILFLAAVCMISCYPDGQQYVHGKDIALTYFDENVDLTVYKTFVMPDSVVFIDPERDSAQTEKAVQEQILTLVKRNFAARNFKLLTGKEGLSPDFVVTVTAFVTPGFNCTAWENYWGWYPGWNDFGWDTGEGLYPWYSGNYACNTFDAGTLVIDMLDAKNADRSTKHIPVLWSGRSTGILAGNKVCLCDHIERNINQCFIQSPYLHAAN